MLVSRTAWAIALAFTWSTTPAAGQEIDSERCYQALHNIAETLDSAAEADRLIAEALDALVVELAGEDPGLVHNLKRLAGGAHENADSGEVVAESFRGITETICRQL